MHSPATSAAQIDSDLFGGAPFVRLFRSCGLLRPQKADLARRALLVAGIAWLPLAALSIGEGSFLRSHDEDSWLPNLAVHARFLVALPLSVLAEALLVSRLLAVLRHFADAGLVKDHDHATFRALLASTRRLAGSLPAELATIALGYAIIAAMIFSPQVAQPGWHVDERGSLSWTGWWHVLVSLPLLLIALLGMLWRWCLWVRLLWRVSRMDLDLVAAHPDGAAGLGFVSYSVRSCTLYGLMFGVISAGAIANQVVYEHMSPSTYGPVVVGLLAFVGLLFAAPPLLFAPTLMSAWRKAVFDYDTLADRVGRQFEHEWFAADARVDQDTLGRPDFSATTDLYSIVANVHGMRLYLFDLQGFVVLMAATAAPFLPVLLFAVPIDTLIANLARALM